MSLRIEITMAIIFVVMLAFLGVLITFQKRKSHFQQSFSFLPSRWNINKREFEIYALIYTVIWIGAFGVVVVMQLYEQFTENGYFILCFCLSLPFLLQPVIFPLRSEKNLPLFQRYSFKANLWIFIFSFIGNYWYTHYFYSVLKAKYTFPSHRLNDVPIALFFATHFYFVTYHTFSNILLRAIETRYEKSWNRTLLFWSTVFAFSYFTAFMETLTISSFPYYSFEDRNMAYKIGSAFYGIYFIVSFPVFYRLDEKDATISDSSSYSGLVKNNKEVGEKDIFVKEYQKVKVFSVQETIMEAMGTGMIVLCLLDFGRLVCQIPLTISGVAYYIYRSDK
jgi:cycloeucalenol cycloisomerase